MRFTLTPLADIAPGLTAVIAEIRSPLARRSRLASFGLVRGIPVRVLRHRPAVVIAVDGTELALDPAIARDILTR